MALDGDIRKMTHAERGRELQRLRNLIRTHRSKKDNARCWLNDRQLYNKALPEGDQNAGRMLLSFDTLIANCRRYIQGQQKKCRIK